MRTCDVLVLGCGAVGTATLMHLAKRGIDAVGIDRFPPAHDRGSSHGETRLIRQAYYEHPDYVPLLKRAYVLWDDLEKQSGKSLFRKCGILQVGAPAGRVVPGVIESAKQHGLSVEQLSSSDVAKRFPGFRVPDGLAALFEANAGFLFVERCIHAQAQQACERGARMVIGDSAKAWRTVGDGVEVETEREKWSAKHVVISAGAWAGEMLSGLGVNFEVVRKSLYWHTAETELYDVDHGAPGFIYETPMGNFYGFPAIDRLGVKAAEHSGGHPVANPLQVDRAEDPVETRQLRAFLSACLPDVSTEQTRFATCLYTLSPDRNFVVDRWPHAPQVSFAAGLSGHGFKFASVLGEILADWATQGTTSLPVQFLGASRFA
jgi:sarcosine oxidase